VLNQKSDSKIKKWCKLARSIKAKWCETRAGCTSLLMSLTDIKISQIHLPNFNSYHQDFY